MKILNIILVFIILILSYFLYDKNNVVDVDYEEILKNLNFKNDSLEIINEQLTHSIDSLLLIENKIDSNIHYINKYYEKELINITNQSIGSDVRFFSKYLSEDSTRFFVSNNTDATKTN